jgi:hypothetical protein
MSFVLNRNSMMTDYVCDGLIRQRQKRRSSVSEKRLRAELGGKNIQTGVEGGGISGKRQGSAALQNLSEIPDRGRSVVIRKNSRVP